MDELGQAIPRFGQLVDKVAVHRRIDSKGKEVVLFNSAPGEADDLLLIAHHAVGEKKDHRAAFTAVIQGIAHRLQDFRAAQGAQVVDPARGAIQGILVEGKRTGRQKIVAAALKSDDIEAVARLHIPEAQLQGVFGLLQLDSAHGSGNVDEKDIL